MYSFIRQDNLFILSKRITLMKTRAFLNVLISTTITLLIISAIIFYVLSHPKESASSAFVIGEKAARAIVNASAETFKKTNTSNISSTSQSSQQTPQEVPQESFSILGRAIQN